MKSRFGSVIIFLVLGLVLACGPGTAATATVDVDAAMATGVAQTKTAQPTQALATVVDMQASVEAQVQLTMAAQQTATPNIVIENPQPPAPLETPSVTAAPTQSSELAATQQAQPMYDFVQELQEKAKVWSTEGTYFAIDAIDERNTQPNYFMWFNLTQDHHDSFVLRADVSWRAAGGADPVQNGCGFVWGYSNEENWHATFLDLQGTVHTFRERSGNQIEMKGGKYAGGLGSSSGEAEMVIAVEDDLYTAFINGMEVVRFRDPYIDTGRLGLAIMNGDSPEGMRCVMENVGIWELK